MDKVPAVSRAVTSLIKEGVEIDSGAPSYLYTKLSELKINMLAEEITAIVSVKFEVK